jgi:putative glycerol-1-phosphate prenyltransferase
MYNIRDWKHVFKLDPNKKISDEDLEKVCESGTDAIIVGGTDGVELDQVLDLMARIRRYTVPCILEVSSFEIITPGYDLYFIPSVLNSRETKWVVDLHHKAVKEYGEIMDWKEILVEGYVVLNENSKVAKLTKANTNLTKEDLEAYALLAEKMFQFPILYIEYSGTYGNPAIVEAMKNKLKNTVLFYGGGIKNEQQALEMSKYADVIVVGNVIYEDIEQALKTVNAVK